VERTKKIQKSLSVINQMNNNPLVSIITPFWNAEEFFVEAIESVIAQTYDNWELLLIDDGSTDGSTAIAKKYAELHPGKIYYLQHPNHQNLGKSSSRNLGIANVRGKYIALLDADDIFLPKKLETQVAILEVHSQAAMVYGATEYWYSWKGNPQEDKPQDFLANLGIVSDTLHPPVTLVTKYLQDSGVVPCTCGLLLRSYVVKSLGNFDESIQHMYEDQILIFKICLNSPVFVESGCHDKYRQHTNSSSHLAINSGEYHPTKPNVSQQMFLNWLEKYVSEKKVNDKQLSQALHKSLIPYRHSLFYFILRFTIFMKNKINPKNYFNKYIVNNS
jgi:glycosyltransferase involved in cell wall biosynthesis